MATPPFVDPSVDPNDPTQQQQPSGYTQLLARLRQLQTGGMPLQQQQNGQVGMTNQNSGYGGQQRQPYNAGASIGSSLGSLAGSIYKMSQPQVGTGGNLPASSMMNIGMPPSLYGGAPAAAPPSFPGDGSSTGSPDMPEFAYGGTILGQNDSDSSSTAGSTVQGPIPGLLGEAGTELLSHSSGAPPEVITKPQVRTLGTQGTDTVTPLTAPPHKVTPAGKNLIKRLHPKHRFDEGGTVEGEDDALYGSDLDAMAAQQRANPPLDAVDESEGAGGPIPAGTANLGAKDLASSGYGISGGGFTPPPNASPPNLTSPDAPPPTGMSVPPNQYGPVASQATPAAGPAPPGASASSGPSIREQIASLQTPRVTPPSMGQRVAAGVLGGLAGWANQKAWRGRPIDTTAATQNILYPGQAQKQAQFNAQAQDLQRQLNMQEGGDKDKMQAAQLQNLQARTGLIKSQTDNPAASHPDWIPDPDPKQQDPQTYPGLHLGPVGPNGQTMYRPTSQELEEGKQTAKQGGWPSITPEMVKALPEMGLTPGDQIDPRVYNGLKQMMQAKTKNPKMAFKDFTDETTGNVTFIAVDPTTGQPVLDKSGRPVSQVIPGVAKKRPNQTQIDMAPQDPKTVSYLADQVQSDAKNWTLLGGNKGLQNAVRTELSNRGVNVNQIDAQTRDSAKFAQTLLPHITTLQQEISSLDAAGKLGPLAGRWGDFMAGKVGAGDPDYERLRVNLGLFKTALGRVHGGARGGASPFMIEHFNNLINGATMDAATLHSGIDAASDWVKGYANMVPSSGGQTQQQSQIKVQQNKAGNYRYSTDGGQTWQLGKPPAQ
jgi:hypothetical protein